MAERYDMYVEGGTVCANYNQYKLIYIINYSLRLLLFVDVVFLFVFFSVFL